MPSTALVIGGGIIGSTAALALQHSGFATTLFDPMREPCGASWGNAGHIAIEQGEPLASRSLLRSVPRRLFALGGALDFRLLDADHLLPFAWRWAQASSPEKFEHGRAALNALLAQSTDAWRRLAQDLDQPVFLESGHFVVWETAKSAAAGLARWQAADRGTAILRPANADELGKLAKLMGKPPAGAIRFANTGQIADPNLLADALADAFEAEGGKRRFEYVSKLDIENGFAAAALSTGEAVRANIVLVAAGVQSRELMQSAGYRVPLIAERGYHIESDAVGWPDELGPLVFEDRSMIITSFGSRVRAAGFVEFARAKTPPDPRKWARLAEHIEALGLPFALPGKPWTGSRPTLPDYLPAIGRSARIHNLIYAFGHQHLGLTLAPFTAQIVADLAKGTPPPISLEPFRIERFN